jgi:uncharacterized membrane protein HdeD (DUF308 family)
MSNVSPSAVAGPRLLVPGAALLLLISSFLPWYHVAVFGVSVNQSGWHQIGVVAWIFAILLLAYEGARLAGVVPLDPARADLATVALAALTLLFGVIFLIVRFSDGYIGWGLWVGVVGMIALAAGAVLVFRSGDAMGAARSLQAQAQAQAQQSRGSATPPPGTPPTEPPPPTTPPTPPTEPGVPPAPPAE